ncbi:MAG: hypothetical protein IIA67_00325 [Planctomycetes bacterium]|nr:hypothetical protein [Planctomycetota bacterium]
MLQRIEAPVRLSSLMLAGLLIASSVVTARAAPPQGAGVESLLDAFSASADDGRTLRAIERDGAVREQMLRAQVEAATSDARRTLGADPQAAVRDLKMLLDTLRMASDVNASVRSQLSGQLETALRTAQHRRAEKTERDRLRQQTEAADLAKRDLQDQLQRDQDKLKRLVEQFNSLIAEGEHQWADEVISQEVEKLDRRKGLHKSLSLTAQLSGSRRDALVTREARRKGLVAALHQAEKSAIPTGDDPPITYPDAEIWEELTLRRAKYAAVDLSTTGGNEEKIVNALKDETEIDFLETPLVEVIDFLKDLHGIEIQLDRRALEEAGFGDDTPVTRNLKGISLRSALRLMLRDLELTYVIKDEVLLITTPEVAETNLTTRAYPVDSIVIPIPDARTLGGGALGGFGVGNNQGGQQGNQGADIFGGQNNGFGQGQNNGWGQGQGQQGIGPGF